MRDEDAHEREPEFQVDNTPRRTLLTRMLAAVALVPLGMGQAASALRLERTPFQTEGPYYPVDWSGDVDHDLVVVAGRPVPAQGKLLHVRGTVLNVAGEPVAGARVEIWQTDANGIYLHPHDEQPGRRRDANFQGRGRVEADASGQYAFRTIEPVAYEGRPPHIHFKVIHPRYRTLITQMYRLGEPLNMRDGVLRRLSAHHQRLLMSSYEPADDIEKGARLAAFNIVLG